MGIEPFDCSATQTLNGSYILGVVVRDSLTTSIYLQFKSYKSEEVTIDD